MVAVGVVGVVVVGEVVVGVLQSIAVSLDWFESTEEVVDGVSSLFVLSMDWVGDTGVVGGVLQSCADAFSLSSVAVGAGAIEFQCSRQAARS